MNEPPHHFTDALLHAVAAVMRRDIFTPSIRGEAFGEALLHFSTHLLQPVLHLFHTDMKL